MNAKARSMSAALSKVVVLFDVWVNGRDCIVRVVGPTFDRGEVGRLCEHYGAEWVSRGVDVGAWGYTRVPGLSTWDPDAVTDSDDRPAALAQELRVLVPMPWCVCQEPVFDKPSPAALRKAGIEEAWHTLCCRCAMPSKQAHLDWCAAWDETKAPDDYGFVVDQQRVTILTPNGDRLEWSADTGQGVTPIEANIHGHALRHAHWLLEREQQSVVAPTESPWVDRIMALISPQAKVVGLACFSDNDVIRAVQDRLRNRGCYVVLHMGGTVPADFAHTDVAITVGPLHARLVKNRYGGLAYIEPGDEQGRDPPSAPKCVHSKAQRCEPCEALENRAWPEVTVVDESPPCGIVIHKAKEAKSLPPMRVDFARLAHGPDTFVLSSAYAHPPGSLDHLPMTTADLFKGWNDPV